MDLEQVERRLRERLDALGPAPRAELLHDLMLPDFERADRIGEFWSYPESRRLRRTTDRLQGGPDAPSGAGRDAAGASLGPTPLLHHWTWWEDRGTIPPR